MKQKSLTDICVISEDSVFISRIKIFSQNSNISFEYKTSPYCKSTANMYLIDKNHLESFLKEKPKSNTLKFIVYGDPKDIARSFNAGCADFLKDPWNNDELEARILKVLNVKKYQLNWNKLVLSQKSISTDNFSIDISIEEYVILNKLIENKNEPVPREVLMYSLWGNQNENSRVVDMHISNLRKKIGILKKHDNSCCGRIKTVRSYGYMII